MAIATTTPDVGSLLREWRERRRLTHLELALDTGISARHLSFVETGRSKPGRGGRAPGMNSEAIRQHRERLGRGQRPMCSS